MDDLPLEVQAVSISIRSSISGMDGRAVSPVISRTPRATIHPIMDKESTLSLQNHMGSYPEYFDSSIPENDRVPWALKFLPQELAEYDVKKLEFEEDKKRWEEEMEGLRAEKLFELRKEVVRVWLRREQKEWDLCRAEWELQRKSLKEKMRTELEALKYQFRATHSTSQALKRY
ncbi:hypothetical protein JR316_0008658 [Psilocybe cubensis]|uniref:Uncharacterized protein n=2 Tax=Psilocybe cubensis TaxID=181762 RepID=A0A8H7XXN1_PSICU|nr:hypothetical protein JR316_0008658 [Psilocybe cubensis]KAH9478205.1 hypothetical protein JR316_0008658 [Psilocybe cubensis]